MTRYYRLVRTRQPFHTLMTIATFGLWAPVWWYCNRTRGIPVRRQYYRE